jgi:hypothetical protein
MINLHKLEDGDIIKLIPRIVDGKIEWAKKVDMLAGLETGNGYHSVVAFDTECKWAYKIIHQSNFSNGRKATRATKYYFNALTSKGEIKVIAVGRTLMNIITENSQLMDLKSNWHLNIKISVKNSYPIFDKSHPVECDWFCPVDINSSEEWMYFITKNQPDLESYFKQNDIYSKRSELINYFGSDIIGQIIGEDRNKKLDKLGI